MAELEEALRRLDEAKLGWEAGERIDGDDAVCILRLGTLRPIEAAARAALSQQPASVDLDVEAAAILNRHTEYTDGLNRGQVNMKVSNALAAVKEALARTSHAREAALRERAAEMLLSAFLAGRGSTRKGGPAPTMEHFRKMAAALLDQPAQVQPEGEKRDAGQ